MELSFVTNELEAVVAEYGVRPFEFFTVLGNSSNPNVDLETQNARFDFVRAESWHSLDLSSYVLWAISDNGDLLWWNGKQTIAMPARDLCFVSMAARPSQFLRLVRLGKVGSIFPAALEA